MTKKNKSKNYVPQGNGEEIRVLVAEPADAMDAVLQFLALLAYPVDSEKEKREPFAKAVHAALYKSRVWNERGNKHDGVAFRTRIPMEYRRLSNRGIDGVVRRGLGRLTRISQTKNRKRLSLLA